MISYISERKVLNFFNIIPKSHQAFEIIKSTLTTTENFVPIQLVVHRV